MKSTYRLEETLDQKFAEHEQQEFAQIFLNRINVMLENDQFH
jgi:hypothetical protein